MGESAGTLWVYQDPNGQLANGFRREKSASAVTLLGVASTKGTTKGTAV